MLVDDTQFPIVRMHYNSVDDRGDEVSFHIFEDILERKQRFVLIGLGAESDHVHSNEERKRLTLWMKRNREALHTYVRAMVYVEPSPAKRFLAKTSAPIFQKFWGYPIVVSESEAEAEGIAARLLAGEQPAQIEAEQPDA
ncbi:hypothetical protein EWE75_24405 [Sphingomonas populi]|uniref:Uncharacterized protein n=1 Tax=Sphingomonas populi TaxID=2484750 RepID=A0A4Q6XMS6_9SPHN|nr:hypothetical protein [Sphingomonas populi]RZF58622.1 hypothetical protein EWE75_24405 [Sphingomonas populi]